MKGRTKAQGVQQEGAEECILTYEGEREWMLGKIALLGTLWIVLSRYYADNHFREDGMVVEYGRHEGEDKFKQGFG